MNKTIEPKLFDLDSGALCLDFSNTVEWRNGEDRQDHLGDYGDLVSWAEAAGIVPTGRADHLRRLAQEQPGKARAAFDDAIRLREAIYGIFAGHFERGQAPAEAMAVLNQALGEALPHLRVVPDADGFAWRWADNTNEFEQLIWPITRSAAELLTEDKLNRVHQCADDRGCGYLFIDTSRNHSRRWCSMESCGNRAKAQRHYKRQRDAQAYQKQES